VANYEVDEASLIAWRFRAFAPYRWPQWRTFKVHFVLGLLFWWAYFATDVLPRVGDPDRTRIDWTSPRAIASIVLLGAAIMFLWRAHNIRSDFRANWDDRGPAVQRQERAEVIRSTVGVTADQVREFRRWRTGAAALLGLLVIADIWLVAVGPSPTAPITSPVEVLRGSWIATIIVAWFLWSTRTFGRIFRSAVVPDTGSAPVRDAAGRREATTSPKRPTRQPPAVTPPAPPPAAATGRAPALALRPVWTAIARNTVVRWTVATIAGAIIQVYVSRFL
jgi:hypothetical protein